MLSFPASLGGPSLSLSPRKFSVVSHRSPPPSPRALLALFCFFCHSRWQETIMTRVCTGEKRNRRASAGRKDGDSEREKPLIGGELLPQHHPQRERAPKPKKSRALFRASSPISLSLPLFFFSHLILPELSHPDARHVRVKVGHGAVDDRGLARPVPGDLKSS